jgi:hypothetical protein
MCGHTFHDYCCVDTEAVDGRRRCPKCQPEFQEIQETRLQLQEQARATTEPFVNELKQA